VLLICVIALCYCFVLLFCIIVLYYCFVLFLPLQFFSHSNLDQPHSSALDAPVHSDDADLEDYSSLPSLLDATVEALDEDAALCATIITPDSTWVKKAQKALLAKPTSNFFFFFFFLLFFFFFFFFFFLFFFKSLKFFSLNFFFLHHHLLSLYYSL